MKISNSMGVTGGQQGQQSVFTAVLDSLNYNYTWAWDASKQEDDFVGKTFGFQNVTNPTVTKVVNSGLRWVEYKDDTSSPSYRIDETDMTTAAHSNGSGSPAGIPDGTTGAVNETNAIHPNNLGHPGRYFSILMTFNKYEEITGHTTPANFQTSVIVWGAASYIHLLYYSVGIPGRTDYVNGQAIESNFTPSYYSGANLGVPLFFTWDLYGATFTNELGNDDPAAIQFGPALGLNVDMDMILHGFVYSDVPPSNPSIPLHITSPTIGSGPA